MEKVIVPLWKREDISPEAFSQGLLGEFADTLSADSSVLSLKICIVDEHVAPAASYRMESILTPAWDAALIAWCHAGDDILSHRDSIEKRCDHFHAYIVTESDRLPVDYSGVKRGQKTDGMNEIVALQKPEWLARDEWIRIWHESHTQIAIDTQSTFGYRQNIVARALTPEAPGVDAFIEENFPEKAIHSRLGFYDVDTEEEKQQREQVMIESCARFIDFEKIDCTPTSEYVIA
mgnify:CR=1 FL=1